MTPQSGWSVRRDEQGHALAFEYDGKTVLFMSIGTECNESGGGVERVLAALRSAEHGLVGGQLNYARQLLRAWASLYPEECQFDPDGHCQAHFHQPRGHCIVMLTKEEVGL